jgi:hypothetical protein
MPAYLGRAGHRGLGPTPRGLSLGRATGALRVTRAAGTGFIRWLGRGADAERLSRPSAANSCGRVARSLGRFASSLDLTTSASAAVGSSTPWMVTSLALDARWS